MSGATVVTAYHEAWTHRDMDTARSCLADDLDFQGPIDTFSCRRPGAVPARQPDLLVRLA
jgi:hypothetical protein